MGYNVDDLIELLADQAGIVTPKKLASATAPAAPAGQPSAYLQQLNPGAYGPQSIPLKNRDDIYSAQRGAADLEPDQMMGQLEKAEFLAGVEDSRLDGMNPGSTRAKYATPHAFNGEWMTPEQAQEYTDFLSDTGEDDLPAYLRKR